MMKGEGEKMGNANYEYKGYLNLKKFNLELLLLLLIIISWER